MLLKMNGFSYAGIIAGLIFSISSWIRYFILFYDLDRAIVYTLIGVIIMSIAWLYGKVKKLEIDEQTVEEFLAEKNTQ